MATDAALCLFQSYGIIALALTPNRDTALAQTQDGSQDLESTLELEEEEYDDSVHQLAADFGEWGGKDMLHHKGFELVGIDAKNDKIASYFIWPSRVCRAQRISSNCHRLQYENHNTTSKTYKVSQTKSTT